MPTPLPTTSAAAADLSPGAPPAARGFESLGVHRDVAARLARRGITEPFPIQTGTIPPALAGRDVCGRAPTGSGKTLAFGIPLVERVRRARPGAPTALVLAPTRELAAQICDEVRQLADPDQSVAAFYGGVGFGKQLRALADGVDVAVACPGRLADLVAQGHVRLDDVELVVLDEADRMADMGFLPEVRRLLDACAPQRQTLLFSATLDGDVDVIIRRYLHDPVRHEEHADEDAADAAEHLFWDVERPNRVEVTASAVSRVGPTVVFCRTKRGADRVARQLASRGVAAVAIHGDRSQGQRERALEDFRSGRARAIVATDVAARGIHVDGVACVVHFDPTEDGKDYVHRSGRTGRAGAAGTVISLVPRELRRDVVRTQRALGREVRFVAPDAASLPEGPAFAPPPARRAAATAPKGHRGPRGRGGPGQHGSKATGGPKRKAGGSRTGAPSGAQRNGANHNGAANRNGAANGANRTGAGPRRRRRSGSGAPRA